MSLFQKARVVLKGRVEGVDVPLDQQPPHLRVGHQDAQGWVAPDRRVDPFHALVFLPGVGERVLRRWLGRGWLGDLLGASLNAGTGPWREFVFCLIRHVARTTSVLGLLFDAHRGAGYRPA